MATPEPFGKILDRRQRFVRPAPTVLHRQVRREDLALNQIRQRMVTQSKRERAVETGAWVIMSVLAVVSFWLVVQI